MELQINKRIYLFSRLLSVLKHTYKLNLFFFIFLVQQSFSQNNIVVGKLIDSKTQTALSGLVVSLVDKDTNYNTISNVNGNFVFRELASNVQYSLYIKVNEIVLKKVEVNTTTKKSINLGNIIIDHFSLQWDSIIPIVTYKKDVLTLNALGFKTHPDAVLKDLILKLPTVTEFENNIYVQGEALSTLAINGRTFFTDNDDVVLKNFPASFIDTTLIYDDVTTLTGEISKTIELIPKKEYQNSLFGTVHGGIGSRDRYTMGANVNYFQGDRLFSIVQQINNTNEFDYTAYDLNNVFGNTRKISFEDRVSSNIQNSILNFVNEANEFGIDQSNGINKNSSFGVSYFDKADKWSFSGNYFFNQTDNETTIDGYRQYFENRNPVYTETGNSISTNINHRFGASAKYSPNKYNTLTISPKLYIQKTNGLFNAKSKFADTLGLTASSANNKNIVDVTTNKVSMGIDYLRKFINERRSLSIEATPSYLQKRGSWALSSNLTYQHLKYIVFDTLNGETNDAKNNFSIPGNIVYTEPLTKNSSLQAAYIFNYSFSEIDKNINSSSYNLYSFSTPDSVLINNFRSTNSINSIKLLFQYKEKHWQFNAGLTYQNSTLNNNDKIDNSIEARNMFHHLLPVAYFHYNYSNTSNLKVNFRTYTQFPIDEQLQNIININNPLNFSEGNINLKPSVNRLLDVRYTKLLSNKISNFHVYSGVLLVEDYIGVQNYSKFLLLKPHVVRDSILVNINKPINAGTLFNAFGTINYNTRFKSISSNFNINLNGKYYHIPQMNEVNSYYLNQTSNGLGVSLNSDISESVDFLISSNTSINTIKSSLGGSKILTYLRQNSGFKINITFPFNILLSTDLFHQYNKGLSDGFNDSYFLWNAFIGYKFLKNKNLEFRFSVHDILNQNSNIQHNVSQQYIEDIRSNNLQRYFLVSFVYNLNISNLKEHVQ